jgi:hypothetical protein
VIHPGTGLKAELDEEAAATLILANGLTYAVDVQDAEPSMVSEVDGLPRLSVDMVVHGEQETGEISDGYHTFSELYDHRRALTAALASALGDHAWRSKAHHPEGAPIYPGYFIVGINLTSKSVITYHYKLADWEDFSGVQELEHAPRWDGYGPEYTVTRLLSWANR